MVVKCGLQKSSAVFGKYQSDGDETRDRRTEWRTEWKSKGMET